MNTLIDRTKSALAGLRRSLRENVRRLKSDVGGSAALEYALWAAGMGLASTGVATLVGAEAVELMQHVENTLCMELRSFCILR